MALTIKLVSQDGKLAVIDDDVGKVGTGHAKPSSKPGYITLNLKIKYPYAKQGKVYLDEFLVIRVPISWLELP